MIIAGGGAGTKKGETTMSFLRKAWYVAAWDEELGDTPLARTLLGEPVVLYRDGDGNPVALRDACPHRFAPLSRGKLLGGNIQCPYHGLVFDSSGTCIHNPNGRGTTPKALSVVSYPLRTSDGAIWIWFGNADAAAKTPPPSYPFLNGDGWHTKRGYLPVQAHYELVTDNLLDLSHAEFLHPFLSSPEGYNGVEYRAEQLGDRVSAYHTMADSAMSGVFAPFFDPSVTRINARGNMHWEAPANMVIETGAKALNSAIPGQEVTMMGAHLLTPETETTSHYFWTVSRTQFTDNEELDQMMLAGIRQTFQHEDEPMIRAVYERMGGKPLFDLSPALLPQDEAAVRARRVLARRIAEEKSARE